MKRKLLAILFSIGLLVSLPVGLTGCDLFKSKPNGPCQDGCEYEFKVDISKHHSDYFWGIVEPFGETTMDGVDYNIYASDYDPYVTALVEYTHTKGKYEGMSVTYVQSHMAICKKCGHITQEMHNFTATYPDTEHHSVHCLDCGYSLDGICYYEFDEENNKCYCGRTAPMYSVSNVNSLSVCVSILPEASGDLVIPEKIDGKIVSKIEYTTNSFADIPITSLKIPASALSGLNLIGSNTLESVEIYQEDTSINVGSNKTIILQQMPNLKSVVMNSGNVQQISITNCTALETIDTKNHAVYVMFNNVPSLTTLKVQKFSCTDGTVAQEPQNLTEITIYGFGDNYSYRLSDNLPESVKVINVDESVTETNNYGFDFCDKVEVINAPGLKVLRSSYYCTSLVEFNAPNLTEIGNSAFFGCSKIESVSFPNVKKVHEYAFANCTALKTVEFSSELFGIYTYAFENCTALEEITIPESVAELVRPFVNNINLKKVNFLATELSNDGWNAIFNGVGEEQELELFIGKNVKVLPEYLFDNSEIATITFESGSNLEVVKEYAFSNSKLPSTITLPASITEVEQEAFSVCTNLTNVTTSGSYKVGSISIFTCPDIHYEEYEGGIYFNNELVKVAHNAVNLIIKEGTTGTGFTVDQFVDSDTKATLKTVVMPNSITSWGDGTNTSSANFASCYNLESVTLSTNLTEIPAYMFDCCEQLSSINLTNVTTIGLYAFQYTAIEEINLPNARTVAYGAFYHCQNATSINIPKLEIVGDVAFAECYSLSEVTVPATVTQLGSGIFNGSGYTYGSFSVTFAEGVTDIGRSLNYNETLTNVNLPSTVTSLSTSAFFNCSKLESINIQHIETMGTHVFNNCYSLASIDLSSVKSFGDNCFEGCRNLTSITLSNELEAIPNYAFKGCLELKSITIPASVQSVGINAFDTCRKLETVDILGDVIIPDSAFYNCDSYKGSLFENAYYKGSTLTSIVDKTKTFIYIKPGTTTIASGVFSGYTALKAVYIPSSVTSITKNEFSTCPNVKLLFGGRAISNLGINYVYDLTYRINVNCTVDGWEYSLSNVAVVEGYHGDLAEVTIPSTLGDLEVGIIGVSAFANNKTITKVTVPSTVINLYGGAFEGCSNLREFIGGANIYMLNNRVFAGCSSLQVVDMPGIDFSIYGLEDQPGLSPVITTVSVTASDFITKLTSTYTNNLWTRGLIFN